MPASRRAWQYRDRQVMAAGRRRPTLIPASVLPTSFLSRMPLSLAAAGIAVQWSLRGTFGGAGALVLLVTVIAALQPPVREID
jgi:hypothetical protein